MIWETLGIWTNLPPGSWIPQLPCSVGYCVLLIRNLLHRRTVACVKNWKWKRKDCTHGTRVRSDLKERTREVHAHQSVICFRSEILTRHDNMPSDLSRRTVNPAGAWCWMCLVYSNVYYYIIIIIIIKDQTAHPKKSPRTIRLRRVKGSKHDHQEKRMKNIYKLDWI